MSFDPDILSTEDLISIIDSALGFNPTGMSREELLVLFSTLSNESEEPPPVTDIVNSIKSHKAEVADSNLVTLQNIENELNIDDAMSESMIRDILWSKENRNEPNEPQNINSDSNDDRYELGGDGDPIFDADETSELNQHIDELQYDRTPSQQSLTQDQEHKIVVFCSITGSETEYAKIMLEASAWDVDTAVSLFLDGSSQPSIIPPVRVFPPPPPTEEEDAAEPVVSSSSSSGLDITAAMRRFTAAGADDPTNIASMIDLLHRMQASDGSSSEIINDRFSRFHEDFHELEDPESPGRVAEEYDEEGIRRPDPVRLQRLISSGSVDHNDMFGRAEDPSVDWMFEPPNDINFPGTLDQAREKAEAEGKWVLVNIQSHTEFSSQLLNRDTWSNESVREFLSPSFIFWQRGNTSQQGKRYMQLYKVNDDLLPHIGIISPQTGAKVFNWMGLIEAGELLCRLMEFQDKHTPKIMTIPNTSAGSTDGTSTKPTIEQQELKKEEHSKVENESKILNEVLDYGSIPCEPQDNDPNAIKISIKLASGKAVLRKYLKNDPVRVLFAVALSNDPANVTRPFDLISRFPARNLISCLDMTLSECDLANGQVFHRWL